FQQQLEHPEFWNQSLLLKLNEPLQEATLNKALFALSEHYDVLRSRFYYENNDWQQEFLTSIPNDSEIITIIVQENDSLEDSIIHISEQIQNSFRLDQSPVWKLAYIECHTGSTIERRLLWICHHLIIDGISWRILISSLFNLYTQLEKGEAPRLPSKTHSANDWVELLQQIDFESQRDYWQKQSISLPLLPMDMPDGKQSMRDQNTLTATLKKELTKEWLDSVPSQYSIKSDELLIIALIQTMFKWCEHLQIQIMFESHGRDAHKLQQENDIDLSDTVGWFTAMYPLIFDNKSINSNELGEILKSHKSILRSVPDQGIGYGVLRWYNQNKSSKKSLNVLPSIRFNYFGQADALFNDSANFTLASESTGSSRHPNNQQDVIFDINAFVIDGELKIHWNYSTTQYQRETIQMLLDNTLDELKGMINYCLGGQHDGGLVSEDFPDMEIDNDELANMLDNL
ncbi:MAG: condensation domain-containing protein, partial [Pseudomonadota bacterium]